jgi:hypothetical protein
MPEMLYWEDFPAGETLEMGSHTFGAEEIIAFARQFDRSMSIPRRRKPRSSRA